MEYVLDACAIIALLNDETGAETVAGLLVEAGEGSIRVFMSSIQALEVYYDRIYIMNRDYADAFLGNLYVSPVVVINDVSQSIIREAGRFKTSYSMSLADSIACATAKSLSATLVTKDEEMKAAEEAGEFSVLWLK